MRVRLDASDLVQETFLKAHREFASFLGATEAELVAWLRQILARNLTDLVRRFKAAGARMVRREQSLDDLVGATSRVVLNLVTPNELRGTGIQHTLSNRECTSTRWNSK